MFNWILKHFNKGSESIMVNESIELLGLRAKDKVTGFTGVISSVSFDLYGCVVVALTPATKEDGKLGDGHWFDIHRLEVIDDSRVMDVPHFAAVARKPSEFTHGAAEKPAPR